MGASQGKRFINMLIDSIASRVFGFSLALFGARAQLGALAVGLLSILLYPRLLCLLRARLPGDTRQARYGHACGHLERR